jgi:hypothetical protein
MSLYLMLSTHIGVLMLLISTFSGLEPSMISTGGSTATPLLSVSSGAGMDLSLAMSNGTETPVVEIMMGSLPPREVIDLTHEPLEEPEGGALPQTVAGVSWKSEGCLVWKVKLKLESLPGCDLEVSLEGGGMEKVDQEENSDCDRDREIEDEWGGVCPPLGTDRSSDSDINGDDYSYSPSWKSVPELTSHEGE